MSYLQHKLSTYI